MAFEITDDQIFTGKLIIGGSGPFCDIFEGKFKDQVVAIKMYKMKELPKHLYKEFDIYKNTSHPNILKFYGMCPYVFFTVFELAPHSLASFYNNFVLSWENIYNFGNQMALAMDYLFSNRINHKHLKSSNIFVTNDLVIKVADFSLTKTKLEHSTIGAFKCGQVSVRWRAPETFQREYAKHYENIEIVQLNDVYSYAMLLWEMRKRKIPFVTYDEMAVVHLLNMGTQEEIDFSWPQHFKKLLRDCWCIPAFDRPTFQQIIARFSSEFDIENAKLAPVEGFKACN
uniref:Protein kinase domain-containing protein n=1 Tax=viral metagenome TaxID=1070528 RepID=A0A6C0CAN6_9ZZZZ